MEETFLSEIQKNSRTKGLCSEPLVRNSVIAVRKHEMGESCIVKVVWGMEICELLAISSSPRDAPHSSSRMDMRK